MTFNLEIYLVAAFACTANVYADRSLIAQWRFDGIKTFPKIVLVASKIKLLNPNTYFGNLWRKFPNAFLFLSLESLAQNR